MSSAATNPPVSDSAMAMVNPRSVSSEMTDAAVSSRDGDWLISIMTFSGFLVVLAVLGQILHEEVHAGIDR